MIRKGISKAICSHLLKDGLVDESQETYLIMSVMDALKESNERICLVEAYSEINAQENELISQNPYQSISLQGSFLKEHYDKDELTDYER